MTGARAFAIVGMALAIVGAAGAAVVRSVSQAPIFGAFGFGETAMIGYVIAGLSWASIGALLVVRRPENVVGWFMVLVGVGFTLSQLSVALTFAFAAEGTAQGDRLAQIAGWVTVMLQLVTILQVAIGFIFPNGHVQSRGWARFTPLFWAVAGVFVVTSLSQPGGLQLIPSVQNPLGFGPDLRGDQDIAPILTLSASLILASLVVSMVSRYRTAAQLERQQLKWFALALGLASIGLGVTQLESLVIDGPASAMGLSIFLIAGAAAPVGIGMAILRYRLYEIDRIISRTIGYALITAALAGVFLTTNLGLGTWVAAATGGGTFAVAASTLLVAALFQPLRRAVQTPIDRRFNRARIDGERTLAAFGDRVREEVDLANLSGAVLATADEAVRPTAAGLWLRRARR